MTDADKNPQLPDHDADEFRLDAGLRDLAGRLDARGHVFRDRAGLVDRVHEASTEHLPVPATYSIQDRPGWVWGRVALAACALLAFAVAARMFMNSNDVATTVERGMVAVAPESNELPPLDGFSLPTESDTVLVALLEAGENGQIRQVEDLQGADAVGAAFAPILGTTGVGFDDYLAEISLIEVELRR